MDEKSEKDARNHKENGSKLEKNWPVSLIGNIILLVIF